MKYIVKTHYDKSCAAQKISLSPCKFNQTLEVYFHVFTSRRIFIAQPQLYCKTSERKDSLVMIITRIGLQRIVNVCETQTTIAPVGQSVL